MTTGTAMTGAATTDATMGDVALMSATRNAAAMNDATVGSDATNAAATVHHATVHATSVVRTATPLPVVTHHRRRAVRALAPMGLGPVGHAVKAPKAKDAPIAVRALSNEPDRRSPMRCRT